MKKIYLVRHGESTSNITHVVQDGTDVLSELGEAQAITLCERLKHVDFENLVVSDYVRTRQTVAPLLALTAIKPVYTHLVRELRRPKELVGLPILGPEFSVYLAEANEHITDPAWHFSDEENFFDAVSRVKEFFALIDSLEGDTVVVTHGRFIIFVIMYVIMGGHLTPDAWKTDMDTFTTTNTGITVLSFKEHKNVWALTTYNDHAHFAE